VGERQQHLMTARESEIILSLCDFTGNWGQQYADAYEVVQVDLMHGGDVRLLPYRNVRVHGIIAQPPCTHFAGSGARWWAAKGEAALLDGLSVVDACLRAVAIYRPKWWVLENPVGRLRKYLGRPHYIFQPSDHGDPYTKRTCLWGDFVIPEKTPVEPTEGSKMHRLPPTPDRAMLRSVTPLGFAKAFRAANP
jgi:hypothetical protein